MKKFFGGHKYFYLLYLILGAGLGIGLTLAFWPGAGDSYNFYLPNQSGAPIELQYGSWPALANQDFFRQVRDKLKSEKTTFIEADLSAMKLTLYEDGATVKEVPILTKGREGSWWETPAGLYRVETKAKNHFSGFAGVYLPWSMPFQGNFFIHGWPYYPDGTPVSSQYSGGCIRLATEDAKQIYDAVQIGTPILVYEEDFGRDVFTYELRPPDIQSRSYLVADLKNDFVFAEANSGEPMPIASIVKLMTALVAVEYVNIEKEITITEAMLVSTSIPRLKAGQRISLYNLLPLLLMESSNEAAEGIADFLGRKYFVALMNQKAKAIGMSQAAFTDTSGRDNGNSATAQDLFALAKYLYNNRGFILNVSRGEVDTRVYGPLDYPDLKPLNGFGDDSGYLGGKVGLTAAAGQTFLGVFKVKLGNTERPLAIILLNSPDNLAEAAALKDWVAKNYTNAL